MNALLLAGTLLAQAPLALASPLAQAPRAPLDPEDVKPGWVALVIVLLMCAATYLLWRSMNRQLKKVDFDDGVHRGGSAGDRGAADGSPADRSAGDRRSGDGGADVNRNGEDGAKTP